jgi:hypothetical protein
MTASLRERACRPRPDVGPHGSGGIGTACSAYLAERLGERLRTTASALDLSENLAGSGACRRRHSMISGPFALY